MADEMTWLADHEMDTASNPRTCHLVGEDLKHEIEVAIHGIEAQTNKNVLKNWVGRMGYCKASRGNHLNDVFHS